MLCKWLAFFSFEFKINISSSAEVTPSENINMSLNYFLKIIIKNIE